MKNNQIIQPVTPGPQGTLADKVILDIDGFSDDPVVQRDI